MNGNARIILLDGFSMSLNPLKAIILTTATTLFFLALLLTAHGSATRGISANFGKAMDTVFEGDEKYLSRGEVSRISYLSFY